MDDTEKSGDDLNKGLREAFGKNPKPGSSVLKRIASRGGSAPQVNLRDVADDPSPVVKPGAQGTSIGDRYQVVGEIARGGVGIVMKGRDVDLGRDVAMKVLLDEHADRAELIERFVEEAQVGGQLQHPGIVPVYEIGLQDDGRPFFAMKLIKGRTLSALLGERKTSDVGRRKYLSIFEQVCHTIAYAHARGVIHRDLKPSNVMVGSFGEVLVVDWGFAKVLAQGGVADEERSQIEKSIIETARSAGSGSQSIAGSILGTPGYMSPEQACGKNDLIDERADVFALGSILCEILTGKAAYADGNLLEMAIGAKLGPAHERLDACSADADLIDLAKRCLEPDPNDRPRHANEIAAAVGGYLTTVEERAQEAKVDAAEARVRAHEERRARKLTLALAASILLALAIGGGGYLWMERRENTRREQAAEEVAQALVTAGERLGAARSAGEDLSRWPDAIVAAERAVEIADAVDADDETRARAEAFLDDVGVAEAEARIVVAANERDRTAERRLTAARLMRGDAFKRDDVEKAFATAFTEYGIDADSLDADTLVAHVKQSRIADELAGALEAWSHIRDSDDVEGLTRLREAARRLDPDPWRTRVRLLDEADQEAKLRTIYSEINPEERSSRDLRTLASALLRHESPVPAIFVLDWAFAKDPSDFWTNVDSGIARTRIGRPVWWRVERSFSDALDARPDAYGVRYLLGRALRNRDTDAAIEQWQVVFRADPDHGDVRDRLISALTERIEALTKSAQLSSTEPIARLMVEVAPEDARALGSLATAIVGQVGTEITANLLKPLDPDHADRLDEALELLERAKAARGPYSGVYFRALHLRRRWIDALAVSREQTADEASDVAEQGWINEGVLLGNAGDVEGAMRAYAKCIAVGHECPTHQRACTLLSNALYQLGRPEEALRLERERLAVAPRDGTSIVRAATHLIALERLEEAEKLLKTSTTNTAVSNLLGVCAALNGDLDRAKSHWAVVAKGYDWFIDAYARQGKPTEVLEQQRDVLYWQAANMLQIRPEGLEGLLHLTRVQRKRYPHNGRYRILEASLLSRLDRTDEGLPEVLERLEDDPFSQTLQLVAVMLIKGSKRIDDHADAFAARTAENPDDALGWLLLGHARWAQERFDDAITAYERTIELNPKLHVPHQYISFIHLGNDDRERAVEAARKAVERLPALGTAWANMGVKLFELGRIEEARDALDRAIEIPGPHLGLAVRHRCMVEFDLNGPAKGLAFAMDRLRIKPFGVGEKPTFIIGLVGRGRLDAVEFCFRHLLEQRPDSAWTRGWLVWALTNAPADEAWDAERVLALSREALATVSDSSTLWAFHAAALSRAGAHEESVATFERAYALGDGARSPPDMRYRYAMSLWHVGRQEDARRELEAADADVRVSYYVNAPGLIELRGLERTEFGALAKLRAEAYALIN